MVMLELHLGLCNLKAARWQFEGSLFLNVAAAIMDFSWPLWQLGLRQHEIAAFTVNREHLIHSEARTRLQ